MVKSYSEAQKLLESYIPVPGSNFKTLTLDRIRFLANLAGNPHQTYPIIHVGGTSGKGSTATFAATILKEAGLKVGLHVSPHLESLTERMQVNNNAIPVPEFVTILNELTPLCKQVESLGQGPPTYFEILVVMSFVYFARKKVDAAVIEVGLGGTWDGTNIVPPGVAIVTNVSLDHTNLLGKTVQKILKDKMGIIKPGSSGVISGVSQPQLQHMLTTYAQKQQVPLMLLGKEFHLQKTQLALPGAFQQTNFTLGLEGARLFLKSYFPSKVGVFTRAAERAALTAFIPGRFEITSRKPLIVLDGAHNKAKMAALVTSLKQLYPKQRWVIVMAVKIDKSYKTLIQLLSPLAAQFVFTKFSVTSDFGAAQSLDPQLLAKATKKNSLLYQNAKRALTQAQKMVEAKNLPLLITGSLFLVGELRPYLTKKHE